MDEIDARVLSILRSLEGVRNSDIVLKDLRSALLKEEDRISTNGPIALDNRGVREALSREKLYFIIKDEKFRPPPEPTVVLTDDSNSILGEEIIPGMTFDDEERKRLIFLGKDFVIYPSRAKGKGRNSRFILPPISFPEIDALDFAKNTVSASPSPLGDIALKRALGMEDDPKLASILIGFDL